MKHPITVEQPNHYTQGSIECWDAMEAAFGKEAIQWFCLCNAFKYVWRCRYKNGNEDIHKAMVYLDHYLKLEDKDESDSE